MSGPQNQCYNVWPSMTHFYIWFFFIDVLYKTKLDRAMDLFENGLIVHFTGY